MHFPGRLPFPVYQRQLCVYQVLEAEVVFLEEKYGMLWFPGLDSRNQPMLLSYTDDVNKPSDPANLNSEPFTPILRPPPPPPPAPICPFLKTTDHFFSGKAKP